MKNLLSSIIFSCVFFLYSFSLFAQNMFQRVYGDSSSLVQCKYIVETFDNGFISAGISNTDSLNNQNIFLMKTDESGNLLWSKEYTNSNITSFTTTSLIQTSDSNIVLCGICDSNCFVLQVDINGNIMWSKRYGLLTDSIFIYNIFTSIKQVNNNYIISGINTSSTFDTISSSILKIDNIGNILWSKRYRDLNNYFYCEDIQVTPLGGTLIAGMVPINNSSLGIAFTKIDNFGNVIWSKKYYSNSSLFTFLGNNNLEKIIEGGYALSGAIENDSLGYESVFLLKIDDIGNLIWNNIYNIIQTDEQDGYTVKNIKGGGFLLAGISEDIYDDDDIYLIKTDNIGNIIWNRTYGRLIDNGMTGFCGIPTHDNMYMVLGENYNFPIASTYLIKTDTVGHSLCEELDWPLSSYSIQMWDSLLSINTDSNIIYGNSLSLQQQNKSIYFVDVCNSVNINNNITSNPYFKIYPNPNKGIFTIDIKLKQKNAVSCSIYNMFGSLITTNNFKTNKIVIDLSKQPKGIYLIKLNFDNGKIISEKIVID